MGWTRREVLVGGSFLGALTMAGFLPAMCTKRRDGRQSAVAGYGPPIRPPGEPAPALTEDIAPVLARLDAWFATHLSPRQYVFNPPASERALDTFEHLVGVRMPRAYRQMYLWHNGDSSDRWGHIYGLPLLPLQEVGSQWRAWNDVLTQFDGDRYKIPGGAWPDGAVDPAYINPRWIPLTHDGSGNHIGIDLDPWPRGRVGQVILFGRDEDVKVVLAESLGRFLEWIAGSLEGGNFRLGAGTGETVLRQFRLKTPADDSFHDGARRLLGAPGPFL